MVSTKTIILGGAILALVAPRIVGQAGQAAGELGTGLGEGISALGSVQIRPALSPEFAPRFAPEIDIPGVDLGSFVDRIYNRIGSEDPNDQSLGDTDQPRDAPDPLDYESQVPGHLLVSGEDDYGD
jgi:hypothetical protein